MKVILLTNILSLGKKGEIKEVNDGYAMNYLLPEKKAQLATALNISRLQETRLTPQAREQSYQRFYKILENQKINFIRKASEQGHLFQAVSTADVVRMLEEKYNISIKPKWLGKPLHFKSPGEFKIIISLPDQPPLNLNIDIKTE
ncbi:MAG: 50S ribosomal protein L9 [Parcubacteria group bacterium]|nr:MAG: 50S ribosomal protein L9 [Parcubacteria group bacterium]